MELLHRVERNESKYFVLLLLTHHRELVVGEVVLGVISISGLDDVVRVLPECLAQIKVFIGKELQTRIGQELQEIEPPLTMSFTDVLETESVPCIFINVISDQFVEEISEGGCLHRQ